MALTFKDRKEFAAGAIFTLVGITWAIRAALMDLGSATSMGPGFFPFAVALVLTFTGFLSIIRAMRTNEIHALPVWKIVPIVFVLAGAAAFAFLIDRIGVAAAALALVIISSPARLMRKPVEVIASGVVIAAFVAVFFVYILGLALPLFGQ